MKGTSGENGTRGQGDGEGQGGHGRCKQAILGAERPGRRKRIETTGMFTHDFTSFFRCQLAKARVAFCERLSTYTLIDIVSVRAGCRYTTYEKEPQVSKVVNQPQVSSSSVLPPTSLVHSSSFHHVCCVDPFIGPKPLESPLPSPLCFTQTESLAYLSKADLPNKGLFPCTKALSFNQLPFKLHRSIQSHNRKALPSPFLSPSSQLT